MITRRQIAFVVFLFFCSELVNAQPLQREWVRNYSHLATKTNQPIAIAIAPDGNVVVAGSSQNAEGDLDYEIIKYKPNGDEAWKVRYGSPGDDQLRAMAIDPAGNIIVTGTSDTVKVNRFGSFVWVSQSGGGRAIASNAEFVYVTGLSEVDIVTVQLENNDTDGRELWRRTADGGRHGTDIGQRITIGPGGNVYVGAQEDLGCDSSQVCYRAFALVSYTPGGGQRWFTNCGRVFPAHAVSVGAVLVHDNGEVDVYGSYDPHIWATAVLARFNAQGVNVENRSVVGAQFPAIGTRMVADGGPGALFMAGRDRYQSSGIRQQAVVYGLNSSNTNQIWSYLGPNGGWTEAADIAQDSQNNIYVAGYSANNTSSSSKSMFLAKLDTSGKQLGLDRYDSPNGTNAFAIALAIDTNDNVYVTGYVLNTNGGSEFVTIKYSAAPKIEKKANGAMHLEFHTIPGQPYAIEATSDFLNWQSLITNTADITGLIQFDDEQAPAIPYRFYRGNSSP